MTGVLAIAAPKSGNAKIGNAATTHAAQTSCPSSCVFLNGGGCYAESGRQGKFVTALLNATARERGASALDVARAEADAIDAMPVIAGRPMRLHTVGDCATDETAVIVSAAAERYVQRGGGPVWTYTHAWRTVARASWGRVSVLASCETAEDIAQARERGYAPSVVVEEFQSDKLYRFSPQPNGFSGGLKESGAPKPDLENSGQPVCGGEARPGSTAPLSLLPCPAQTRHGNCADCRLCMDDQGLLDRGYAIGFELHGIPYAIRQARLALQKPDDPERRMPSEERIRVIRERFLTDSGREPTVREVSEAIDLNAASVYEWLRFLRGETDHPAEVRRRRDARRATA